MIDPEVRPDHEVRPCPKGHRDRYADGACRPCAIERARARRARHDQFIANVDLTVVGPRLDDAVRRLGMTRSGFMRQAVIEKLTRLEEAV